MGSYNCNQEMFAYVRGEGMMKKLACDNCGAIIYRCPSKIRFYNVFCSAHLMNENHKKMHRTNEKCNECATMLSEGK